MPAMMGTLGGRTRHQLERRLLRRRGVEALHRKGRRAHGRGDLLLRHDRGLRPLLTAALKVCGLYQRGVANAQAPVLRRVSISFPSLPAEFEGFRLLHLSDLHIDGLDGLVDAVCGLLSEVTADVCVMTGDYRYEVDGPCGLVYSRMQRIAGSIQSRHGILAVLGNHDEADMALEFEKMGIRMLINEGVEVQGAGGSLWFGGVDDPHYFGCDDLSAALQGAPREAFKILLAHSPEIAPEAAAKGVALYLCGHTHCGQISLPWVGPPLLNAHCPKPLKRYRWQHAGMQGYTSAGAGSSLLPVRFNCPPEIVEIEMRRA